MVMIPELRALEVISDKFKSAYVTVADQRIGWGQFLDIDTRSNQIGPYGTAAGVIVMSLAGERESSLTRQAVNQLEHWINYPDEERNYANERMCQTVRLAWVLLALRIFYGASGAPSIAHLEARLHQMRLPNNAWSAYSCSTSSGATSCPIATAMAIFALNFEASRVTSVDTAKLLHMAFKEHGGSSEISAMLLLAAFSSGFRPGFRVSMQLRLASLECNRGIDKRYVYFYTYDSGDDARFKNGYVILPGDILWAVAGSYKGVPDLLIAAGQQTVAQAAAEIAHFRVFRPSDKYASTVDQAWCAIMFHCYSKQSDTASRAARIWHWIGRERHDNYIANALIPSCILLMAVAINAVVENAGIKILTSIAIVIVSSSAPGAIQRLFRLQK